MNIPGFTADASLYETRPAYNPIQDLRISTAESVIPQARVLEGFCIRNGAYCCFKGPDGKWTCGRTIST